MAREAHVLHDAVHDLEVEPKLVPAQRVGILERDVGVLERPAVPGVLVMVENMLAIEVFHAYFPKRSCTFMSPW